MHYEIYCYSFLAYLQTLNQNIKPSFVKNNPLKNAVNDKHTHLNKYKVNWPMSTRVEGVEKVIQHSNKPTVRGPAIFLFQKSYRRHPAGIILTDTQFPFISILFFLHALHVLHGKTQSPGLPVFRPGLTISIIRPTCLFLLHLMAFWEQLLNLTSTIL